MLSSHLYENDSKLIDKDFQSLAVNPKSLASVIPKSASPPNDQDLTSKVAEKIYVGHLASHVQKRDLEDLFGYYGPLLSVEVKHGGFAFVHFQSQQDAQDAVAALHNFMFDGRSLTVEFSLKKGNTASNGCLVCGKEGHWARDCPESKEKGLDVKSGKCFKCGQGGHLARFCRKSESKNGADDSEPSTRTNIRDRERSSRPSSRSNYYPYPADYSPHHRDYRGDYRGGTQYRDYRVDRDRDYIRTSSGGDYMGSSRRPRSPLSPRGGSSPYPAASNGHAGYYERAGYSEGGPDSHYRYGSQYRNSSSRPEYDDRTAPGGSRYDDERYGSRGPAPYDYMDRDNGLYPQPFHRGYSSSSREGGPRRDYYSQRGHDDSRRTVGGSDREYQGTGGGDYVERR